MWADEFSKFEQVVPKYFILYNRVKKLQYLYNYTTLGFQGA